MTGEQLKSLHLTCAGVLLLAGVILLSQILFHSMMGEEAMVDLLQAGQKFKRSHTKYEYPYRAPTDEEIKANINAERTQVIKEIKEQQQPAIYMKVLVAGLLLAVAIGLFLRRRSPTLLLAAILLIILGVGLFGDINSGQTGFAFLKEMQSYVSTQEAKFLITLDTIWLAFRIVVILVGIMTIVFPPPEKPMANARV